MTDAVENQSSQDSPRPIFYDDLAKFVPREKLVHSIRLTSRGVFIEQSELPLLFDAYQAWQKKIREDAEPLSPEKIRKRLLGSDPLPLLYLVEGKKCLLGHIVPNSLPRAGGGKQIPNTGTLFDPQSYLDMRDPIFTNLAGVRLRTAAEGIQILFETKRVLYECGPDLIKRFAEFCRHSPQLLKEFPETKEALRNCLLPLRRLLELSRPHDGKHPLLVPMEFSQSSFQFLQYRSLIIVLQEKKLLAFYDLKGKGETFFIRLELARLGGNQGDRHQGELNKIRGFTSAPEKSFHLGKIWYRGMSFLLHPDTFRQYMRIHSSPRSKKPLPPKYTVLQVMNQLVPAFIRSQVLDDATSRKLPLRLRKAGAKYRRFSNLVFIITDKNVISSCVEFRTEKPKRRAAQLPTPLDPKPQ